MGGVVALAGWLGEPAAHASEARAARDLPAVEAVTEAPAAEIEAASDSDEDSPATWWKRPTPMDPADAARHLGNAWEDVLSERASAKVVGVLWAQWALETGRGRWMVDYNFAGLKGRAPDGGSALWWTWEETEEGSRRVRSRFRAYATPEAGARDYIDMLRRRYPEAVDAARRGDAAGFIQALDRRGYFTEAPKAYGRAVLSLSREFMRGELSSRFPDA